MNPVRLGAIWTSARDTYILVSGKPDSGSARIEINGRSIYTTGRYDALYGDRILVHTSYDSTELQVPDYYISIREKQLDGTWRTVAPNSDTGYSTYAEYEFIFERSVKINFRKNEVDMGGLHFADYYSAEITPI